MSLGLSNLGGVGGGGGGRGVQGDISKFDQLVSYFTNYLEGGATFTHYDHM